MGLLRHLRARHALPGRVHLDITRLLRSARQRPALPPPRADAGCLRDARTPRPGAFGGGPAVCHRRVQAGGGAPGCPMAGRRSPPFRRCSGHVARFLVALTGHGSRRRVHDDRWRLLVVRGGLEPVPPGGRIRGKRTRGGVSRGDLAWQARCSLQRAGDVPASDPVRPRRRRPARPPRLLKARAPTGPWWAGKQARRAGRWRRPRGARCRRIVPWPAGGPGGWKAKVVAPVLQYGRTREPLQGPRVVQAHVAALGAGGPVDPRGGGGPPGGCRKLKATSVTASPRASRNRTLPRQAVPFHDEALGLLRRTGQGQRRPSWP